MSEKKTDKNTFVLCDEKTINSYGFRTLVSGIDTSIFAKNPVMLYRHHGDDIIGRWENIRKEDGKLLADATFDMDDELGAKIAGKVERGFIRGCSMGLEITSLQHINGIDTVTESVLCEASICGIPADSGALRLMDGNNKELTYEQVKLAFLNNNLLKINNMEKDQEKNQKQSQIVELEAQIASKDKEIAELKAKVAAGKKEAVDAYLEAAVVNRQITATEKAGFAKLAEMDFDTVKSIIDARKPKASASLKEMEVKHSSTDESRKGWTYMEWMKKDPKGLKKMKLEDPEQFRELQKTLE